MDIYFFLLGASGLIVVSHLFNWFSNKTKVPSVLLLIGLGVILNLLGDNFTNHLDSEIHILLKILGALGLIFIVLEGSLDLSLDNQNIKLAGQALASACLVFAITTTIISSIFFALMDISIQIALVYAIPLSIISSAIAIPTATHLNARKRGFIIYESTFSDILGILFFNYLIIGDLNIYGFIARLATDTIITVPTASIFLIAVLLLIHFSHSTIKLVPMLAVIIAVYAITKLFHLPALLLILALGLLLKNVNLLPGIMTRLMNKPGLDQETKELKSFVTEISFLIRTFFFIVFGYTLPVATLLNSDVLIVGSLVFIAILLARLFSLRYILGDNLPQELFMAPRGLVTVILFFGIPDELRTQSFNDGIVYFVIIASSLLMMTTFLLREKPYTETPESLAGN